MTGVQKLLGRVSAHAFAFASAAASAAPTTPSEILTEAYSHALSDRKKKKHQGLGQGHKTRTPNWAPEPGCRNAKLLAVVLGFSRGHETFEATQQVFFRHAVELDVATRITPNGAGGGEPGLQRAAAARAIPRPALDVADRPPAGAA